MSTGPETTPSTRRLIVQHAQTLRLMGVDFLPAHGMESAETAAPIRAVMTSAAPSAAAAAPVRPIAGPPQPAVVSSGAPIQPLLVEPKPSVSYDRADQVESQRKLDALRARYEREAPHQHFVTDHHSIVFGEGDPRARLMFIGEAPGAEEDKVGRPFVGRAGQLLDKMIVAMGLRRQDVYIANVLKTRPPNNATPTLDECMKCAPFLFEQVAIIRPEVIVTLGLPATRTVLNTTDSMSNLRGKWASLTTPRLKDADAFTCPVMPTYHPAFLLRAYTKDNRQKVWSDLQMAAKRLGIAAPEGASPAEAGA